MHDPRNLLLFVSVMEQESMAAAARQVGLSRSTVARRMALLEDELGVQLMMRNTHDLALTQAGELYLERAREIRAMLTEAEARVQQLDESVRGRLRIAAPIIDHRLILNPLVRDFLEEYPQLSVEVALAVDVRELVAQGMDVGLQIGLEDNAELTMRRLFEERLFLAASPMYLERRGVPSRERDVLSHDTILMRRDDGSVDPFPLVRGGHLNIDSPRLITNSVALHRDAIVSGLGIGVVMEASVRQQMESGALVEIMPEVFGARETYSLVHSSTRHTPPKIRAFIDFTSDWIKHHFLALYPSCSPPT